MVNFSNLLFRASDGTAPITPVHHALFTKKALSLDRALHIENVCANTMEFYELSVIPYYPYPLSSVVSP